MQKLIKKRLHKFLSIAMTLIFIIGLLPAVSLPAAAADDEDEENVLSALGFDTSAEPDGYVAGEDSSSPYGVKNTAVAPVKELYTIGIAGADLYGDNLDMAATTKEWVDSSKGVGMPLNATAYQGVAGNFDGNGLDGQVALLRMYRSGTDKNATYNLDLNFIDPTTTMDIFDYSSSTRRIMVDVKKFANSSTFIDDFIDFPNLYQGYLQIAAGDFDGNGIDEIVVYIPYDTNPRIKVFQLQESSTQWQTPDAWTLIKEYPLSYNTYAPNQVGLTACDMTGDGIDDLGITWGGIFSATERVASQAVVLRGSKAGDALETEIAVPISDYEGYGILSASLAFGDVDGDGNEDDLVLSGQSMYDFFTAEDGNRNPWTRYLAAYKYDSDNENFTLSVETNVDLGEQVTYLSVGGVRTALAVVKKDGIGTQDYVYVDGVLLKMDSFGFSVEQPLFTDILGGNYYIYNVTAADFNGDGKETVVIQVYNPSPQTEYGETVYSTIYCETNYTDLSYDDSYTILAKNPCAFAAPDTDQDTMKMTYTGEHHLIYSDPKILAVVAAPPYFGDLEHLDGGDSYVGNSETTYASTSGSSITGTATATLTSGLYVSFEQELAFLGIKGAKMEAELEVLSHITAEYERSKEMTQTVEYGTSGGQDTVALYTVPIDVFVYDVYVPTKQSNGSIKWEKQTMTVDVPYNAAVRTLTVEDYDVIAENFEDLPTVRGNILDSTPGYPASYPSTTAGYNDVNIYDGSYAGVGYGSAGFITQSLAITEETSIGASYTGEITLKVGGGILGFSAGPVVGIEAGGGLVYCNMTGSEFSGTVFGMPEEAEEYGYGYNWKIFKAMYSDGDMTFPVVTYVVNSVIAPADLPSDFCADVENITSDSIPLTWKVADPSTVGFQLYRHYEFPDGEGDYPVSDVISIDDYASYNDITGEYTYSYTDEDLDPYTQYQYCIQSISGTSPYYSVPSDMVSAYTAPETGQPEITLSATSLQLHPDDTVNLSVTVTNDDENAKTPLYQWQRLVDGEWENLSYQDTDTLTFSNADAYEAGTYRCRVNQVVGAYYISTYSDRVEVSVSKRTPEMTLSVIKESDTDIAPEIQATLTNNNSDSIPSGTVAFEITGDENTQTVTVAVASDGTATLSSWTAPENGFYSITASYNGNRIFKNVRSETTSLIGTDTGFGLEIPDEVVYGGALTPDVSQYTSADSNVTRTAISELADYTLSYKIYRSSGSNWTRIYSSYSDYPISGNTITPTQIGSYKLEVILSKRYGSGNDASLVEVATLARTFTVLQRSLTVTAPSYRLPQDEPTQPTTGDLIKSDGSLAFSESLTDLGLGVECLTSAGTAVTITSSTSPGVYTTRVTADSNYSAAQANYDLTFINGTYAVTGLTYPVTISAKTLMGETVGTLGVFSPQNFTNGTEYQYGTEIVFVADPNSGYEVDNWKVTVGNDTEEIDPDTLENPNLLTKTIHDEAIDVVVTFKVQQAALTFGGTNGSVVCVDSAMLQSGDNVIAGASYTFKAIPDAGYHFKEWRLYAGEFSYPADAEDIDGFHTCTLTMGAVSANLMAVFERDNYVLSLGDHLIASYYWDNDDDSQTDDVLKAVSSGAEIMGDTEVTVQAAAGHCIADDGKWYVDNIAVTTGEDDPNTEVDETVYYSGQNYAFNITQDTTIDADTTIQYYDVTVTTQWLGSGADPDGNTVAVSIDGTSTDLDALTDLGGSSAVAFTAVPAYGAIFDHWSVNGATIDPDTLADPQVYTCVALGEDLEVTAFFTENEVYTVTVSKEAHGAMGYSLNGGDEVPLGSDADTALIPVYEGDTLVFTAAPDTEFMVSGWTVDGTWYQTTSNTWTLSNIDSNRTLSLNFAAKIYYTVEFSADDHGSVSAVMDDTYTLTSGERPGGGTVIEFNATPNVGYMVAGWTVDGETVKNEYGTDYVDSVYTIDALSRDTTVSVSFRAEQIWTITVPAQQEHYTLTSSFTPDSYGSTGSSGSVRDGASTVLTVIPDPGYLIDSLSVTGTTVQAFDDVSVLDDGTWICTINAVTEDLVVEASGKAAYTVTIVTVTGGTATADLSFCTAGTQVTIKAAAQTDYTFSGWTVGSTQDGTVNINDKDAPETWFTMPTENVTVTPYFTYTGGSNSGGNPSSNPGNNPSGGISGSGSPSDNQAGEDLTITDSEGNVIGGTRTNTENGARVDITRSGFNKLAKNSDNRVTIDLGIAEVTFDSKAMDNISGNSDTGDISLSVEQVDPSDLPVGAQVRIGSRPVFDFTLMASDTQISNLNGKATVSVPYTLQAGENPETVVIYYIDDSGALNTVRGRYNPATSSVNFTVTHFSIYAIGYNEVIFDDVSAGDWYYDAVTFCSARKITTGTGNDRVSPNVTLTRGQFLVMLMRAYDIKADETSTDNFNDAGDTYYTGYLSVAKRLKITNGVGNNLYAPESKITRQDMFTLLYRALDVLGELPEVNSISNLSDFSDADDVSDYANEAIEALVASKIISGSDGKLDPLGNSTRAQMAQLLYKLLSL